MRFRRFACPPIRGFATLGVLQGDPLASAQDEAFLSLAISRGLLKPADAKRLWEALGQGTSAARAVVEQDALAAATATGLLRVLAGARFACKRCPRTLSYGELAALPRLDCPSCGSQGGLALAEPDAALARPRARPSSRRSSGALPSPQRAASPSSRSLPAQAPRPRSDAANARPRSDAANARPRAPSSRPVKTLGGYELLDELGRGNNGVVYLAQKPGLARRFALKVLLKTGSYDAEMRQRFELEAQIASKLDHPGIIPVFDVGRDGDHDYYAMEFCEGPTLAQVLKRGALEARHAADMLAQIAEALQVAHLRQVVHRDLKPANVIVEASSGRARITDFGLARDSELAESMTKTGDILGTPYYMAPEQLRGERPLDGRADVYALGVILYEALAGRRPYSARSPFELARRVFAGDPPSLLELNPTLPTALVQIQQRAMAVDKADRHQSAAELGQDLRDFLEDGQPRKRKRPHKSERKRSQPRTALWAIAAVTLLTFAGAAGAIGYLVVGGGASEEGLALILKGAVGEVPADEAELQDLEERLAQAKELDAQDPRVLQLERWVQGWRGLATARAALAEAPPDLGAARQGLELAEAGAATEHRGETPALQRQVNALGSLLSQHELLEAHTARDGKPYSETTQKDLERLALAVGPLGQRARSLLMDYLAARLRVDDYARLVSQRTKPSEIERLTLAELFQAHARAREHRALLFALEREAETAWVRKAATALATAAYRKVTKAKRDGLIAELAGVVDQHPVAGLLYVNALLQARRYREARASAARLAKARPHDGLTLLIYARALLGEDKLLPAEDVLKQLTRLTAGGLPRVAYEMITIALGKAKRPTEAEAWIDAGRRSHASALLDLYKGALLRSRGDNEEALTIWKAAYRRSPRSYEREARLQFSPKEADALIAFVRGGEATPTVNLGVVPRSALARANQLASRATKSARPALRAALEALTRGEPWSEAAPHFEEALRAAPRDPVVALELARARVLRDRPRASEALARARSLGAAALELAWLDLEVQLRHRGLTSARPMILALKRQVESSADGDASAWAATTELLLLIEKNRPRISPRRLTQLRAKLSGHAPGLFALLRVYQSTVNEADVAMQVVDQIYRLEGFRDVRLLVGYWLTVDLDASTKRRQRDPKLAAIERELLKVGKQILASSPAAWPRLSMAEQIASLRTDPADPLLAWAIERLAEVEARDPTHGPVHALWAAALLRQRAEREVVLARLRKAREKGVPREKLDGVFNLYRMAYGDDKGLETVD